MQPHMTKIAQKFAKNRKKLLSLEGGGVLQNSTWFSRGVGQKTMSVHKGEGGQKCPKFRPYAWFMDAPSEFIYLHIVNFPANYQKSQQCQIPSPRENTNNFLIIITGMLPINLSENK